MSSTPAGLLLTPGASADADDPTLVAIAAGLPELPVMRLTLATTSVKNAVGKIAQAAAQMADETGASPEQLVLGGRSFGGRSCSVAVADGLPAAGLVLLSYPLHPPGKPDKLRVDHLDRVDVPTLLVSGERDPFGSPAEFDEHLPSFAGPTEMRWIPGGHSPKGQIPAIVSMIRQFVGLDPLNGDAVEDDQCE